MGSDAVATEAAVGEVEGVQLGEKYNWYRGVFFQATIVGIAAFAAPGLWNAMQSVGAGGQQTPFLVMAGNAVLFSLMTVTCLSGSILANRIGLKNTLILGGTGYVLYSAALYTNNRYRTQWFIYFGSACCGITAGLFWAAEGAIMISYPEPKKRGRYLSYWLCYRNSGSILGGIINLAFNAKGKRTGKLDWRTYIVFVVLQCFGPVAGLFLSPPEKVRRRDGSRVQIVERVSDKDELKALGRVISRREVLMLFPFFIYVNWSLPASSSYLSLYFTVRARALASLVAALAQITATLLMGAFLDWDRFSIATRARAAYIFTISLIGGCWIWAIVVQNGYTNHKPALDWVDSDFGRGWALYIFLQVNWSLTYNYGYWLVASLAREPADVPRLTSIIRSIESAGQCIASGISSTQTKLITQFGTSFGLWGLAVIPTYIIVHQIGSRFVGLARYEEEQQEQEQPEKLSIKAEQ